MRTSLSKPIIATGASFVVLISGAVLYIETRPAANLARANRPESRKRPAMNQQVNADEELGLTAAQSKQYEALLTKYFAKSRASRSDPNLTPQERFGKLQKVYAQVMEEAKRFLTPDQIAKMQKMADDELQSFKRKMGA